MVLYRQRYSAATGYEKITTGHEKFLGGHLTEVGGVAMELNKSKQAKFPANLGHKPRAKAASLVC